MLALSKHINFHQVRIKALSLITSKKRVSFSFPFIKASITVEAAIVLPIFLFYIMTILYSLEIVRFQTDVWEAMHQISTAKSFQAYESCYGNYEKDNIDVNVEVNNYLTQQLFPYLCVKNKELGINISEERNYMGIGNIQICAEYEIAPFIKRLPIGQTLVKDSCFVHGWVGYTGDSVHDQGKNEIYVYITPAGEKYHYEEDCTYLKVQVMAANMHEIESLRNASGEIYYECEICKPKIHKIVFYTKWGNRYHSKSDCQALRKTVYIVPISETKGRTVCHKCEKNKMNL